MAKIKIESTDKHAEMANFLLMKAIEALKKNYEIMYQWKLTKTDLRNAQTFRKQIIKSLTQIK